MATIDQLKDQIIQYMDYDADEFRAGLDTIIDQAQLRIFRSVPTLECFKTRLAARTSTGLASIDRTGAVIRNVFWERKLLQKRDDSVIRMLFDQQGDPMYYTVLRRANTATIQIAPVTSGTAYQLFVDVYVQPDPYFQRGVGTTTWLLSEGRNALLYACLVEAAIFLKWDPMPYMQKYQESIVLLSRFADEQAVPEATAGLLPPEEAA